MLVGALCTVKLTAAGRICAELAAPVSLPESDIMSGCTGRARHSLRRIRRGQLRNRESAQLANSTCPLPAAS